MDTKTKKVMMTNLTSILKKYLKVFLFLDIVLIVLFLVFSTTQNLINSQVAFFSVLIIVFGSFLGYHRNISKQIENFDTDAYTNQDNDAIDKIEDPYDLYSEDGITEETEISTEEFKQIIKEEKQNLKRNTVSNTLKSASGFASLYRIIGYVFLVIGFFYLNNNEMFDAISYIIGISIIPLAVLIINLFDRKEVDDEHI
jgi:hypothetical protein